MGKRTTVGQVVWIVLLVIALPGCSNVSISLSPTASAALFTDSPTPSATPTIHPRLTPTATSFLLLAPTKSTPGIYTYELPEWVKNPENNLVLFKYKIPSKIGFFNPIDGTQVIVRLPLDADQYFWKDTNSIVFLQGPCGEIPEKITELDLSQGSLRSSYTNEYPEEILGCYPSLDSKREIMQVDDSTSEPNIITFHMATGEWSKLTNPRDGISDISFAISPNRDYVAVVQTNGEFEFPLFSPQPIFGTQVSIYHLPDKKRLATFKEADEIFSSLVFNDDENLIYISGNTPCIISISTLAKKCVNSISEKFPNEKIILGERSNDQGKFSFIYFDLAQQHSGVCFYDTYYEEINCPTDHFETLNGETLMDFSASPDDAYILIEYDQKGCPPPWCDYAKDPQLAIIDIQQNKLYKLGSSIDYQALNYSGIAHPWRPIP